jgi:predicted outer membrane repeat protein
MFRQWLNEIRRRVSSADRPRRTTRLGFEVLEGRVVPTAFLVTTLAGSGTGSLRAAINAANADTGPSPTTIDFQTPAGGVITLNSALPTITRDMKITGPGADTLTVSLSATATNQPSIFTVGSETSTPTVTLTGLRVTGGNATFGGAVFNWGTLTVNDCTFANNTADYGGAIYTRQTSSYTGGVLRLNHDTFANNTAGKGSDFGAGGAIDNYWNGSVRIFTSAFIGNTAHYGGAVSNEWGSVLVSGSTLTGNSAAGKPDSAGGAIINNHDTIDPETNLFRGGNTLTVASSTVVGNTATAAGGGIASSGISDATAQTVVLTNTILANNTNGSSPDISSANYSTVTASYSIIGSRAGAGPGNLPVSNSTHNQVGQAGSPIDPKLTPLGYYGGPTPTIAPLAGSPALGTGDPNASNVPNLDQRGLTRIVNNGIDVGAFETQSVVVNAADDTADGHTSTGSLTLRDALNLANALAPAVAATPAPTANISFAIPTTTGAVQIQPVAALPVITTAVNIDATTEAANVLHQPYSTPLIDLNGALAGVGVNGIDITGAGSTVRGLVINNFHGEGVFVHSTYAAVAATNGATESGTTATVTTAAPHGFRVGQMVSVTGVGVAGYNGTYTITATPTPTTFTYTAATAGLAASGGGTAAGLANNNTIVGNWIGTAADGTFKPSPLDGSNLAANDCWGVEIQDAPNTAVGGADAASRNVISGNKQGGVTIFGGNATGTTVAGNYIGLDQSGTAAAGNGFSGILVGSGTQFGYNSGSLAGSASNTTVGGAAGGYNYVAANGQRGLWLAANGSGNPATLVLGNVLGYTTGGARSANGQPDLQIDAGAAANLDAGPATILLKAGTLSDAGTLTVGANAVLDWAAQGATPSGSGVVVANGTVKFDSADSFAVANVLTGSGRLTQAGPGTVALTGSGAGFSGTTTVVGGVLLIDSTLGGAVNVQSGGTLGGTGVATGPVSVTNALAPGDGPSRTGRLQVGSLTFTGGGPGAVNIDLNGPTAGTGYDQIVATGAVNLTNSTLKLTAGYTVPLGTSFVIVSAASLSGTFADPVTGLPLSDGQVLSVSGQTFRINYNFTAGTVTLTRI